MEESKSTKESSSEQAPNTAIPSSESPISAETSSIIVEQSHFGHQQEIITQTTDSKLLLNVSDALLMGKILPTSEDVGNKLQGDVAESSLQQSFEGNQLQGLTADGSKTSIQRDVPDTTSSNQNTSTASSNVLASDDDDVVVISLGNFAQASSDSLEKYKDALQESLQEHEVSSASIAEGHSSNRSSAIEIKKKEERSPASPIQLKTQSNAASVKKDASESAKSSLHRKEVNQSRSLIDTAAPIESVKQQVTKFGGIVDWRAYRAHTLERRKHIQSELERVRKEIPDFRKQSEAAEEVKAHVLTELESTKRIIEELKLNLERAQTEEAQAKQDSELAQLRAKEAEQGISGEASVAAKAQLEVAKARYEAAVREIKSVREELNSLRGNYASLLKERDLAMRKAKDAVSASKEIEKTVEDLTLELIATKEALESAHAEHLEAEEHNIGASLAKDQDCLTWEKELKQAEKEVERLNQQILATKDIKSKIDIASTLLLDLKGELAAYIESKLKKESEITEEENSSDKAKNKKKTQLLTQSLMSTKKELEEVKASIDKSRNEVNNLTAAASSMKSELDREKSATVNLQQREGMASVAVSSLEAELDKTKQELETVKTKEKEARNKMMELPKLLQQAALEADQAKSVAQSAREDLWKAKEEAEEVKAHANTIEVRLTAALKETEAAKASERLALEAIKALEESEQASSDGVVVDSSTGVALPLNEYFNLSKQAHEAEILAQERVALAISQIQLAKDSESNRLARLNEALKDRDRCKEALRAAMEKAEKAKEGKLGAEQELRNWRAEHERKRKANDAAKSAVSPLSTPTGSATHSGELQFFKKEGNDALVHALQPGFFKHSGDLKSMKKDETDVLVQAVQPGSFKHSGESKSLNKEENTVLVQAMPDEKVYISESSPEAIISPRKNKKKKKSLFRILMFFIKKKHQATN